MAQGSIACLIDICLSRERGILGFAVLRNQRSALPCLVLAGVATVAGSAARAGHTNAATGCCETLNAWNEQVDNWRGGAASPDDGFDVWTVGAASTGWCSGGWSGG